MTEHTNPIEAYKALQWLCKHPYNRVWSLNWCTLNTKPATGRKKGKSNG
jgi:hypothetical protein